MSLGHRSNRRARLLLAVMAAALLPALGTAQGIVETRELPPSERTLQPTVAPSSPIVAAPEVTPQQGISGATIRPLEVSAQGPRVHPEDANVRVPLEAYIRGHATGDSTAFRRAFWKDARLWWMRDGMVATRTTDEYIASESGERRRDPLHQRRIVRIEVSGETAIATVEVVYPSVRFTDHITLLKVGDEWRIINKAFIAEPLTTVT